MAESARSAELLESAYRHTHEHGLVGMSLRPLAQAVGSSPRVLLYLFGSKDGLVSALLERARADELALLQAVRRDQGTLAEAAVALWRWLAAPEHGRILALWTEAYARSLVEPDGAWAGFAAADGGRLARPARGVQATARRTRRNARSSSPCCAAPCSTSSPPATAPASPRPSSGPALTRTAVS